MWPQQGRLQLPGGLPSLLPFTGIGPANHRPVRAPAEEHLSALDAVRILVHRRRRRTRRPVRAHPSSPPRPSQAEIDGRSRTNSGGPTSPGKQGQRISAQESGSSLNAAPQQHQISRFRPSIPLSSACRNSVRSSPHSPADLSASKLWTFARGLLDSYNSLILPIRSQRRSCIVR